ncbi:hypothetical protein BJ138DRAFT_1195759, partial [Hygrophoropsis aurantiaca]
MAAPPVSPRRTRPGNATAHPGQPVLDIMQKRRTRSQKESDDRAIQDAKDAKELAAQKGYHRIAELEMAMEDAQNSAKAMKAKPVRPKPRPKGKVAAKAGSGNDVDDELADGVIGDAEDATSAAPHPVITPKKAKRSLMKAGINSARKHIVAKGLANSTTDAGVNIIKTRADGQGNAPTSKSGRGGRIKHWSSMVSTEAELPVPELENPTTSASSTMVPPSTLFSEVSAASQTTTSSSCANRTSASVKLAQDVPEDALVGGFADFEDDSNERAAALSLLSIRKGKTNVAIIEPEDDILDMELDAPLSTQPAPKIHIRIPSTAVKRKASEVVPETEGEATESSDSEVQIIDDAEMEVDSKVKSVQVKKEQPDISVKNTLTNGKKPRTTATTSVGVSDRSAPASKK